jgi:hypothetical protein
MLDTIDAQGVKFALSNVIDHKGIKNSYLIDWAKKYNTHFINYNYDNCSYNSNNKNYQTKEVLIVNY